MFANMRGFTQMAQTLNSPENTQNRLNEFLTMLAEEVIKHNGIVNKFLRNCGSSLRLTFIKI